MAIKLKEQSTVASQRVADIIADRIIAGELPPGARIKQDELAKELNVSRIPVRDALRILETRGLVSLKPNAGATVTSLTTKELDVSYRIREILEPFLLADSIPHLTAADIESLGDIKNQLDHVENMDIYMALSRRFHWTAFSGNQSPMLAQIVERLWDSTQSYRRAYAHLAMRNPSRMQIMRDERTLLFGMISRREVDLASRFLAIHIRRTHMALTDVSGSLEDPFFQGLPDSPVGPRGKGRG